MVLVDENFKPKRKPKATKNVKELLERIESLETELENERQRADEAVDKCEELERELNDFENDDHAEYRIMTKNEYYDHEDRENKLDEMASLGEDLRIARERAAMGVDYAHEEIKNIIEQMEMIG